MKPDALHRDNGEETLHLLMADDLMPFVHSGKKRITIRQGWRKVLPGELLIVATEGGPDGDFVTVNVTSLTLTIARNVSEEDLLADGFTSVEDMVEKMRRFYPDFSEDTEVTIIRW